MDPKFYEIGPGWPAFVATFSLAIAAIVLFRSLTKHLRKVRREASHQAAAAGQAATTDMTSATDAGDDAARLPETGSGVVAKDGDGGGDVVAGKASDGE